jgi:hypothetical protein
MLDVSASLAAHMQQALQRYQSKLSVDAVLRGLPKGERQAVLIDLLAAYDEEASGNGLPTAPHDSVVATSSVGFESISAAERAPTAPRSNATTSTAASVADRLLAVLQAKPEAPIEELTLALYGTSDTANKNRLSTVLTQLKRRGKVHMVRRGKWRVVDPNAAVKPRQPTKRTVAGQIPAKPAQISTSSQQATKPPSVSERVHAVLVSHPEGLTTGQIRELLGPEDAAKHVSTVVTKMRIRGVLVAAGERGSSVYKLSEGSSKGGE